MTSTSLKDDLSMQFLLCYEEIRNKAGSEVWLILQHYALIRCTNDTSWFWLADHWRGCRGGTRWCAGCTSNIDSIRNFPHSQHSQQNIFQEFTKCRLKHISYSEPLWTVSIKLLMARWGFEDHSSACHFCSNSCLAIFNVIQYAGHRAVQAKIYQLCSTPRCAFEGAVKKSMIFYITPSYDSFRNTMPICI